MYYRSRTDKVGVMARLDARLELRLDRETHERLLRRAAVDHLTVAQLVRKAIARELAEDESSWREEAVERALLLQLPVPDDPAELARELSDSHQVPALPGPSSAGGTTRRRA